ncbi:MAG: nitroreductase family protein [Roseburia sp.]|nr:nitroreductase family protein [Roseburia sp.]
MGADVISRRRSIRRYKQTEIPSDVLNEILEAGRLAPSGKNRQPWRFLVYGRASKRRLLERMEDGLRREAEGKALLPESAYGLPDAWHTLRVMREAPTLIMVINPYGKSPFEPITAEERVAEIVDSLSIGAAIENMLLAAEAMGIGSLWIANTCFAYPELMEELPTGGQLVGAVALGYADETPAPRPRKPLAELVSYFDFREPADGREIEQERNG